MYRLRFSAHIAATPSGSPPAPLSVLNQVPKTSRHHSTYDLQRVVNIPMAPELGLDILIPEEPFLPPPQLINQPPTTFPHLPIHSQI